MPDYTRFRRNILPNTPAVTTAADVLFNEPAAIPGTESHARRCRCFAVLQEAARLVEASWLKHDCTSS
jgi:hypothetical protein